MPFDISSAKPVGGTSGGFDLGSAKPIVEPEVEIKGDTPEQIYYNFVIGNVPAEKAKVALAKKGMEFNPRLYRQAIASAVSASPEAQQAIVETTGKTLESEARGVLGAGASMLEGVAGVVPGETATDVEQFFRQQERKQREAAPFQDVYGTAKAVTTAVPYVAVGSKVAGARALASPFRQFIAQPAAQALTAYGLTPREQPTLSDLVTGEPKAPEGAVFGLLGTTGSRKLDEAITAATLTGITEIPFVAAATGARLFTPKAGMPPSREEAAAYDILRRREGELAGGAEGRSVDEQLAAARQQEETLRQQRAALEQKQAADAAARQKAAAEAEAARAARQQKLIEQRRQAQVAEQEAAAAQRAKIEAAEAEKQRIKEEAEARGEQLRAEAVEPQKEFPNEDEILRQEKISDAQAAAESDLETSAAKLEERAAERKALTSGDVSGIKKFDLGEKIRNIFNDTREKLIAAREKAIGKTGEPKEGSGKLPHEKEVVRRSAEGPLSDTEEFTKFADDIKTKAEDPNLTPTLKKPYRFVRDVIDTFKGTEEERAISWQLVRNLRREIADRISSRPEAGFSAIEKDEYRSLASQLDDLLDSYVGGTKGKPGLYKSFMSAYSETSRPLDIFKFGPGQKATEMAEWGRGLEYDREEVLKAAMHPTRSNAEQIVELSGDRVGETADVVRDFILKQAGGDTKKLNELLDTYDEFLGVPAFSGIRSELQNLVRTNKLNSGIASRLSERAQQLRASAEAVKKLPEAIRKVLNVRDFTDESVLGDVTRYVNANPQSKEKVVEALGKLVDGMPDNATVLALSNPSKRAALVRAGLPDEEIDALLTKANDAIADRAAKIQEAKTVTKEARKAGRALTKEAREPVTAERQRVRELGAEIGKVGAERQAAVAAERAVAAEERAAAKEAAGKAKEAKALRVSLEERRRALSDINQRPDLAEEIIDAASEIPIRTSPGLVNATTMAAIYGAGANFVANSKILSWIASAIGASRAISSREARLAMEGTEREAIRNKIKEELQKMITSPLKREETRQVIENYNQVMDAQREANEILRMLGVVPPASAISAKTIIQSLGGSEQKGEPAAEEPEPAESAGPDIDAAVQAQNADALRPIIDSIYEQESSSGTDPEAAKENYAGAKGVMQVTPVAFKEVKEKGYLPKDYSFDNPQHLAEAGVAYIKLLADKYNNDPEKIAAAYYGGPGAISQSGQIIRNRRDPSNPKAPTVGQYVDKVLSRIIPTAQAGERVMARGGAVYAPDEQRLLMRYATR